MDDTALMMLTPMYNSLPPSSHATATTATTTTTTASNDGMPSLAPHDNWGADLDFSGALLSAETSHPSNNNMYDLDILHLDEPSAHMSAHGNGVLWQDLEMVGAGPTPFVHGVHGHVAHPMHQQSSMSATLSASMSAAMTQHHHLAPPPPPPMAPWLPPPLSAHMPQLHPPPPPPMVLDHHQDDDNEPAPVHTPPKKRRVRAASDDEEEHSGILAANAGSKPRRKINVTKEWLEANGFFDMRARDAALKLGIGVTTLKRYCRSDLNLDRWPWRKRVGASKAPSRRASGATGPRRSSRRGMGDEDEDVVNHGGYSSHEEEETVAVALAVDEKERGDAAEGVALPASTQQDGAINTTPAAATTHALMCC